MIEEFQTQRNTIICQALKTAEGRSALLLALIEEWKHKVDIKFLQSFQEIVNLYDNNQKV